MNKAKYYLICFGSATWDGRLHEYEAACKSAGLPVDKFFPGYWENRLDRHYAVVGRDYIGRSLPMIWHHTLVTDYNGHRLERIGKLIKAGAMAEELFA